MPTFTTTDPEAFVVRDYGLALTTNPIELPAEVRAHLVDFELMDTAGVLTADGRDYRDFLLKHDTVTTVHGRRFFVEPDMTIVETRNGFTNDVRYANSKAHRDRLVAELREQAKRYLATNLRYTTH